MRIDSVVGNSVVAGHSHDANYMSPARSHVSSKGSNAGLSPQFDIESVHSRQGLSPHHGQPSDDQQAIDLNDELIELAQKFRTVLDSMIAEKNRVVEEKQALESRLAITEEKVAKLVEKKNTLAEEKARLSAGTAQKEAQISKLEKQNTKVEMDNNKLVERNTQLVDENAKLVEDKANLTDAIIDDKNTILLLQKNINQVRNELVSSSNENEKLKQESRLKEGEIEKLKSENQEREKMLQEAKALSDRYVKKSEEQAEMLKKSIKKKDGQIAEIKREKAELAHQMKMEIELKGVANDAKEKRKNFVLEEFLDDEEKKVLSELKKTRARMQELILEGNVAAEMPGTSSSFWMTAGKKRKAPEMGHGGPQAANFKLGRNAPKKQGKGAKN